MQVNLTGKLFLAFVMICCCSTAGFGASSYDRELIVQDKTRAMQVESVFKEMMAAYEDEDARGFLDYVSDERFRQDYITFTDALYNDFRNYEIHQVEYWIDRVMPDNVKQFLYVKWEKRYENLDDGQQLTQKGFSRFLFDEVDGDYLLIELAGNHLFGGSLQEWREEVPVISGQDFVAVAQEEGAVCDSSHLNLCDGANCSSNGGYWYDNTCNQTPYNPAAVCDSTHLNLCDSSNCSSSGGYWYNNSCNQSPEIVCDSANLNLCDASNCSSDGGGYWYNNTCNATPQGQADLIVRLVDIFASSSDATLYYVVENTGNADSAACQIEASYREMTGAPRTASDTIAPLAAGETRSGLELYLPGAFINPSAPPANTITIDSTNVISESNESNNTDSF